MKIVNLSRRPFINRRPVARIALILWLLGLVLAAVALSLFARYWSGSADYRARLAEVDAAIDLEQAQLDTGLERLQRLDLETRNDKALEANRLIERRTFPWSKLFDDLEDVIPRDVRISSVSPSLGDDEARVRTPRRSGRAMTPAEARARRARGGSEATEPEPAVVEDEPEEIDLELPGLARNEQAMLDFVDALYAHPRFRDPFLSRETREPGGEVRFGVSVTYLVPRPERQPPTVVMAGPAGPSDTATARAAETGEDAAGTDEGGRPTITAVGEGGGEEVIAVGAEDEAGAASSRTTSRRSTSTRDAGSRLSERQNALEAARARRAARAEQAAPRDPDTGAGADARRRPSDRPRSTGRTLGDAGYGVPVQGQSDSSGETSGDGEPQRPDESPGVAAPGEQPRPRQPAASSSPRIFGSLAPALRWLLPDVDVDVDGDAERSA